MSLNADTCTSPRLDLGKKAWSFISQEKKPGHLIPRSKMTWNKLAIKAVQGLIKVQEEQTYGNWVRKMFDFSHIILRKFENQ